MQDAESVENTGQTTKFEIIVNGRRRVVDEPTVTFRYLVGLAFDQVPTGENILFTITYRNGPKQNPRGSMVVGDSVAVANGMVFNVTATDKS